MEKCNEILRLYGTMPRCLKTWAQLFGENECSLEGNGNNFPT